MSGTRGPATALGEVLRMLGGDDQNIDTRVRQAAWVARCVGRGAATPLTASDVSALADVLEEMPLDRDTVVFQAGRKPKGVWIVREGQLELAVGSGRKRAVLDVLHPGDVDCDIPLLLDMAVPYTARALTSSTCLFLPTDGFESLLHRHPTIARRWLSSVAMRLATSQNRILGMLGRSLTEQVARLLLDEAVDGRVALPQRTLAAMLGVQRPSLNKVLKELEQEGLLAVKYSAIDITDARRLAARTQ